MEVEVESVEKGFLIKIWVEKNSPRLLVSILEAFEEVGVELLDARVSSSHSFKLEALGEFNSSEGNMDGEVVKHALILAVQNWKEDNECAPNPEDHSP